MLASAAATLRAQGGPPFRTDDPETPGAGNWEINFGFIGDRNPSSGAYQVPDFDVNYGLGDRIQLKYELPIALAETRPSGASTTGPSSSGPIVPGQILGGLGESLLGVKWRFYEHRALAAPAPIANAATGPAEPVLNFSVSTYPQLSLKNPTSAVRRGVVEPGPQLLLPVEINARLGPVRVDAEAGYWLTNRHVAQSWIRGIIVGHEFSESTEAYVELYDQQDTTRANGDSKQREFTLGAGGRQALNRHRSLLLLLMGGKDVQAVRAGDGRPTWIAYAGLQLLIGHKPPSGDVERKLPIADAPPK